MASQKEIDFINMVLAEWSNEVTAQLHKKVKEKGLVLGGDLLRSINHKLTKASAEGIASMGLFMQEYGRMQEMRNITYSKQAPVAEMEEFVRKTGLSHFKYIPGYEGKKMPTENVAIRRVAWGLAISKRNNSKKRKPVKWFNKTFYSMINSLIEDLLTGYSDFAVESFQPTK